MQKRCNTIASPKILSVPVLLIAHASAVLLAAPGSPGACAHSKGGGDPLVLHGEVGQCGGRLVTSKRAEPKTLNPLTAVDSNSREIIGLMTADLIHINRNSQLTEPALAKSWTVSADRRRYTMQLRRGVRFSDGQLFEADDVLFTFQSYLDERTHAPQRDLLVISGKPLSVSKIDQYSVAFTLPQPYAAAERLFDGIAILPRHLLQRDYDSGKLASAWGLNTSPTQIAGLGPFRLREYVPGQRIVLERNPYYWKVDTQRQSLPYLDEIICVFAPNSDAEALRFVSGETDVISRLSVDNFAALERDQKRRQFRLYDLGPGLEYSFLFFNLNSLQTDVTPPLQQSQNWFRRVAFRKAISAAIDHDAIVRLIYRGRAYPLAVEVTPGNRLWANRNIPLPIYSPERARQLLREAGLSWKPTGSLRDDYGRDVRFSIMVNVGNAQQMQLGAIIQEDLKQIGIEVSLVSLEYRTFLSHIFTTHQYEAAIMALVDGDADPNTEINVLTSHGGTHVWALKSNGSIPAWQGEIDFLMQRQMTVLHFQERKRDFDRVQHLLWQNMPAIFLVSPNILV